jgi:uncharacterized protein (DUF58 family)
MDSRQFQQSRYKKFENLEFFARQVVEGFITGMHKSPFHGFSVEFAEHRIYNPGESTKNIDWKLYARTDKLYSKRYEEETNLRCQIIIDSSSSMFFPAYDNKNHPVSKLDFSAQSAACLIYLLKKQRDAVGISVFSEHILTHTPAKSNTVHNKLLFNHLENLLNREKYRLNIKSNPVKVLHEIAEKIHRRSLVIIFSDMIENMSNPDEIFGALQHMKHNKHEVILFHVFDQSTELDLDLPNRPYKFIDMETSKEMKVIPEHVRENFKKASESFHQQLKFKCMQYKIDFIRADINQGFENVLLSFLHKRSKLL